MYLNEQEIQADKEALLDAAYDILQQLWGRGYFDEQDDDSDMALGEKAQARFVTDDIEQHLLKVAQYKNRLIDEQNKTQSEVQQNEQLHI